MAGHQFVVLTVPQQPADLGLGIHAAHTGAVGRVPKANVMVRRAATGGQQRGLPGAPGEGLDGSSVLGQGVSQGVVGAPDVHNVVIATTGGERERERNSTINVCMHVCIHMYIYLTIDCFM